MSYEMHPSDPRNINIEPFFRKFRIDVLQPMSLPLATTVDRDDSQSSLNTIDIIGADKDPRHDKALWKRVEQLIQTKRGYTGRLGQVATLVAGLHGEQDVFLQAPAGYGKSLIWEILPHVHPVICKSFEGLHGLFPDQVVGPDNIQKTLIFFDSKEMMLRALRHCRRWLLRVGYSSQ